MVPLDLSARLKQGLRHILGRPAHPPPPANRRKQHQWSIGIYAGASPVSLSPPDGLQNPVLTNKDVSDLAAQFVADPFMLRVGDTWYMFFEVMNRRGGEGGNVREHETRGIPRAYTSTQLC